MFTFLSFVAAIFNFSSPPSSEQSSKEFHSTFSGFSRIKVYTANIKSNRFGRLIYIKVIMIIRAGKKSYPVEI